MFKSKFLWIAIAVFGVLPPVIILFLYDYSVTGEVFSLLTKGVNTSLSKKSESWSDFGSLLSGVFTLLGAIASLATLIFLLQQQKKSERDRLEQLKIQREIQNKNDEHLRSERELMNFEIYKIHKDMFDNTLRKIEIKIDNGMSFTRGENLYKMLFPKNKFSFFSSSCEINENPASHLKKTLRLFEKIAASYSKKESFTKASEFTLDIISLNDLLGLKGCQPPTHRNQGDLLYMGEVIGLNMLTPFKTINDFHYILGEILEFTENEILPENRFYEPNVELSLNLMFFGFQSGHITIPTSIKNIGMHINKSNEREIYIAVSIYEYIAKLKYENDFILERLFEVFHNLFIIHINEGLPLEDFSPIVGYLVEEFPEALQKANDSGIRPEIFELLMTLHDFAKRVVTNK